MNGEELRRRREEAGLSQEDLSRRLGMSDSAISYWENGRHIPTRKLARLEAALRQSSTKEWDNGGVLVLSWH